MFSLIEEHELSWTTGSMRMLISQACGFSLTKLFAPLALCSCLPSILHSKAEVICLRSCNKVVSELIIELDTFPPGSQQVS